MSHPVLSIVITCYNLGNYLEEAIESIKQYSSSEEYEIILVNDGSNDKNTISILKHLEINEPRVIVLNQPNLGVGKARNNGIKLAKGKFIIPLDADNKLRPAIIAQTISILNQNVDVDIVHGNVQLFGNKSDIWYSKPFNIEDFVLTNYIDTCAGFRKTAWELVGGYDENRFVMGFEDWDLWLRMAVKGFNFQYVDEIFFDYRVRDNSLLSKAWENRETLLDYIFSKKELTPLGVLRKCLIENKKLREEPSFTFLIKTLLKKIKRKLKF